MSLFEKRKNLKPLEYPEVYKFVDAINHSYWLFSEWNFKSDIQDYHVKLTDNEKEIFKRTLLCISQIEVQVKRFWANLYNHFPKPEFDDAGVTFAESEVRHQRAYSNLLEILGLNSDFEKLLEVPQIQGRIDYLAKYLKNANSDDNKKFTLSLSLFSLFIEGISLFSQFLIVKSFNKERNLFKDIDNVISATQLEETLHSEFGIYLITLIKKECPDWFNEEFYESIEHAAIKAYKAERDIIDWIFENQELDFLSKNVIKEFIKDRFNIFLVKIGGREIFDVNKDLLKLVKWFDLQVTSETHVDFFHKTSSNYNKKSQSINADDLF